MQKNVFLTNLKASYFITFLLKQIIFLFFQPHARGLRRARGAHPLFDSGRDHFN